MTEAEIKREIAVAFEYAYRHEDWVEPLQSALAELDAERAARRFGPEDRSVGDIVLHLALWNENIVARIQRGDRSHPEESWPAPAEGEVAWEAAQERLRASYAAVIATIEATPLDRLAGGYGLADLLCRLVHCGYHLGQIVKMRELASF